MGLLSLLLLKRSFNDNVKENILKTDFGLP